MALPPYLDRFVGRVKIQDRQAPTFVNRQACNYRLCRALNMNYTTLGLLKPTYIRVDQWHHE